MTLEQLKAAHNAKPFIPFRVRLADGRKLPVPHPEFLLIPPTNQRTFVVADKEDVFRMIALLLVSSLDFGNGTRRKRRKNA